MHAQDAELESALRVSELARDRTLRDHFADQEWRRTKVPEAARSRLEAMAEGIQELDERIAVAPDVVERIRLESERTLAVSEKGRLERELRSSLDLGELDQRPPTLDELRAHLADNTALVSVLHSGETWWALVILHDAPAQFVVFPDPDIGRNAAAWLGRLRGDPVRAWPMERERLAVGPARPAGATGAYLDTEELARRLERSLMAPLRPAIGARRRLVFVGDEELVGVPLQALPLAQGLVVDRYAISYAPSLSTYARWQGTGQRGRHPRDLLAVGAIDYRPVATGSPDDPIAAGMQYAAEHPLPYAREEIAAISSLFPPARTQVWTGAHATKAALRLASHSGELRRYRFVHIAAHAWAQAGQPESAAIALGGRDDDAPAQHAMTAAELAGLRMNADLIVLSACDTGLGHFEHGQGLLGLAYAGLAAGNRAALLSLWPIADDTTALFMTRLYERMRSGADPVLALAETQRAFRQSRDPRLADPIVWAPFVIYGGY